MSNGAELPDDVETPRALLVEARAQLAERDLEIGQLKAQIDKLKRMQFGRKSEQLDREVAWLETALEDLTGEHGVADVRRARQSSANTSAGDASPKEALPPHLPRQELRLCGVAPPFLAETEGTHPTPSRRAILCHPWLTEAKETRNAISGRRPVSNV